jgi:hypothetical protein
MNVSQAILLDMIEADLQQCYDAMAEHRVEIAKHALKSVEEKIEQFESAADLQPTAKRLTIDIP